MQREATAKQCRELLTDRQRRFHGGGVGLLIEDPCPPSDLSVTRTGRRLRVAAIVGLLGVCMAGSFASARMWNNQGTDDLPPDLTRGVAQLEPVEENVSRLLNATGALHREAMDSIDYLLELSRSPNQAVRDAALSALAGIRKELPGSEGVHGAKAIALDATKPVEEREKALLSLNGSAFVALSTFRQVASAASDLPLGDKARGFMKAIARHAAKPAE